MKKTLICLILLSKIIEPSLQSLTVVAPNALKSKITNEKTKGK